MSVVGKPGYIETDFGLIPIDWQVTKLGNLVTKVGSGVTPKGGSESYLTSGVPLIRSQNVLWGKLNLSDVPISLKTSISAWLTLRFNH